jgi:oligosaccharide repeat unit polymerase
MVAFVIGLLYQEQLGTLRRYAYLLAGFSTVVSAVVSAGRYTAIQIAILTVICVAIRRINHLHPFADVRLRMLVSTLTIALVCYMLAIPFLRDRKGTTGFSEYAASQGRVEVDEKLVEPLGSLGPAIRDSIYGSYVYLGMPIENFRVFYFVYAGRPQFGAFEQGTITRQIARVFPQLQTFEANLKDRNREFFDAGESSSSWQTLVRDAVIDFGWIGCLVFAIAMGTFARFVYERAASRPSIAAILTLVGTCFVSVHSIMYSVIGVPDVLVLIGWGVVIRSARKYRAVGSEPVRVVYPRSIQLVRSTMKAGA